MANKEDIAAKAAAAAAKRSTGGKKKGGSDMGYKIVIGSFVVIMVAAVYASMDGGAGGKSKNRRASPLDTLVNDNGIIGDVNYKTDNFTAAASPFFDKWTLADMKYGFDGARVSNMVGMAGAVQRCEEDDTFEGGAIPTNFDGREKWPTCFGEIYDSGNCTASYAIAGATTLSARFCVADEDKFGGLRLSPQQVLSCDKKSQGCQGGGIDSVFAYMKRRGLYPEECLKYAGKTGAECKTTCDEKQKKKPISYCVMGGAKTIQREILANGPVVMPMPIMSDFLVYSGGIYTPLDDAAPVYGAEGKTILQAVTVYGWGKSKGISYWLVENSWGKQWGEEGFAKIAMGQSLMEHYTVVPQPETEEAIALAAKKAEQAAAKKEQARLERIARDERIAEAQRKRAEEAAAKEMDDLDADDDVDLDDIDAELEKDEKEETEM
eukprot:TRINITY_DN3039_c0_g1_i1.p2 TRINITY_DN3039_c0_g1~~TRINITY_DN3039_c0_g1_i1.p2  ORF type:complete len:436 (-),score=169.69 TRINITY_DN3039_c0_g1_i1:216-1523(-)